MSKTVDFLLPDLGEGVHEAELISWKVAVGDEVEEMQTLAEMETDKALVEVPSPYTGTIVTLHGKEGEILHVGKPLVSFANATQSGKDIKAENGVRMAAEAVGSGDAAAGRAELRQPQEPEAAQDEAGDTGREDAGTVVGTMATQPTMGGSSGGGGGDGKVMATPAVRRLARELGVDINSVTGTGRGGRVTASDIEAVGQGTASTSVVKATLLTKGSDAAGVSEAATTGIAKQSSKPSLAAVSIDSAGVSKRIAFRGVRRKIAEALSHSLKTAAHFTVMDTADVTRLEVIRRQQEAASGEKVSFLAFIIQAVCRGLKQFPQLNANVDDANSEILIKGVQNIGIAVDTEHGLMVPVINNADRLGVIPLQREVNDLAQKCRSRTIPLELLKGGTFTISNVGSYGGSFATPIINYPEVAILGSGRAKERVLVRNGGIYIGLEMPLSMSCDHRVVDGAECARLLNYIVQLLETPEILLEPAGN